MGEFGTDSLLVKPGRKMFHVVFVGREMVMVIVLGLFLSLPSRVFISYVFRSQ